MIQIEKTDTKKFDLMWPIIKSTIETGETYVFNPKTAKNKIKTFWTGKEVSTYLAKYNNAIAGTYILKDNQPGLGSHVANAAFMVDKNLFGKGIGKAMAKHAFQEAKKKGYKALQFNMVVSTNTSAICLWKKLGFKIIGTVPKGFKHSKKGLIDVYIMHKFIV